METRTAALAVPAIDGGQSAEALERGVRGGEIESLRVEAFPRPLAVVLMLLVGWVGQCFEEIGITAGSAAIFGWAGVLPGDANRELEHRVDCVGSLHHHLVLPGVAEVIVVAEPLTGVRDVGELELDFMQFFVGPVLEVHPVQGVPDPELVKVAVRPAHRLLEDHVELVEPKRAGDKYPAPDLRPVIQQADTQPEDIRAQVRRSGRSEAPDRSDPKLIVRVRFPSPAPGNVFPAQVTYRPSSPSLCCGPLGGLCARCVPDWPAFRAPLER